MTNKHVLISLAIVNHTQKMFLLSGVRSAVSTLLLIFSSIIQKMIKTVRKEPMLNANLQVYASDCECKIAGYWYIGIALNS